MRSRNRLLAIGAGALLGVVLFGSLALYARDQIATRDVALAEQRAAEARLSGDLSRLSAERDELLRSRETTRRERDEVAGQRDLLATARDSLTARVTDLERRDTEGQRRIAALDARAADLERALAERERQLAAARATPGAVATPTVAPTPTPTPAASASATADVRRLIELDDQIKAEFDILLGHIDAVSQAFVRGNIFEVNAAYQRGLQSGDRLKDLFNQRAPVLDRLR